MKTEGTERSLAAVPRALFAMLGAALALQLAVGFYRGAPAAAARDLPPPPARAALRLAGFGDSVPVAKLLMLYVQAFDLRADNRIPYQALDYGRLAQWLGSVLELDPAGQYPLHAATRLYAQVPDEAKVRTMLDFIYRQFGADLSSTLGS